ncbi:MAG TPA: glycosyltransferase family 39 protein [Verrucomicrobiae bacterium]|nr:glycosyltransferase family 39 protein [Verrucomicrobiae bacterium]
MDRGTYRLDPVHPPLARLAIALPLYIAGKRYPALPDSDADSRDYNVVGNHILYDDGHWLRNIILARIGVLPFFILGAIIVHRWTSRLSGNLAAVMAVFLYCTTPTVLAFSSIAYTDIVAAATQLTALFAFSLWLDRRDWRRSLWLGAALGLALLAKMTTLLFIPASVTFMLVAWLLPRRREFSWRRIDWRLIGRLATVGCIATLIVWAGYRFSVRPLQEATGISPAAMPSFQHFPRPLRATARSLVLRNPRLPAPELLHGIALAWALNSSTSQTYLFGHIQRRGWWYFYLVALGVKLPLSFLLLFVASIFVIAARGPRAGGHDVERSVFLPLSALAAILLVTMHVSYQVGVRHVMVAFPLMAILAGVGSATFVVDRSWSLVARWAVVALLATQLIESASAQSDFLSYFNTLAAKDPSRVLVMGCDLDCGQDVLRLAAELHSRHISRCALLIWSSADTEHSGLPPDAQPDAQGRYQGWIALSARAARMGDVLHESFSPGRFAWLEHYQPVAKVGNTIRLFYVGERRDSH